MTSAFQFVWRKKERERKRERWMGPSGICLGRKSSPWRETTLVPSLSLSLSQYFLLFFSLSLFVPSPFTLFVFSLSLFLFLFLSLSLFFSLSFLCSVGKARSVYTAVNAPVVSFGGGLYVGLFCAISGDMYLDLLQLFVKSSSTQVTHSFRRRESEREKERKISPHFLFLAFQMFMSDTKSVELRVSVDVLLLTCQDRRSVATSLSGFLERQFACGCVTTIFTRKRPDLPRRLSLSCFPSVLLQVGSPSSPSLFQPL